MWQLAAPVTVMLPLHRQAHLARRAGIVICKVYDMLVAIFPSRLHGNNESRLKGRELRAQFQLDSFLFFNQSMQCLQHIDLAL